LTDGQALWCFSSGAVRANAAYESEGEKEARREREQPWEDGGREGERRMRDGDGIGPGTLSVQPPSCGPS